MTHNLPDPAGGLEAIHLGHLPVDEDEVVRVLARLAQLDEPQRIGTREHRLAADANLAKDDARVLAGNRVVVDDQHAHLVGAQARLCMLVRAGRGKGHGNGEGGSHALLALHLNAAVHELDEALGDGKAKPRAAIPAGKRRVFLRKGVKHPRQELLAHADAGVAYNEA